MAHVLAACRLYFLWDFLNLVIQQLCHCTSSSPFSLGTFIPVVSHAGIHFKLAFVKVSPVHVGYSFQKVCRTPCFVNLLQCAPETLRAKAASKLLARSSSLLLSKRLLCTIMLSLCLLSGCMSLTVSVSCTRRPRQWPPYLFLFSFIGFYRKYRIEARSTDCRKIAEI